MAVRQHILPRFLLKGFASRTSKNEVYTWVYKKEGQCYETNIINVAVQKYFYGEEGDGTVDEKITDFESEVAPLLDELRSVKNSKSIPGEKLVDFVAHLEVRTKHLRDSLCQPGQVMAEEFRENAADIENIKKVLSSDPTIMDNAYENQLDRLNVPPELRGPLKDLMIKMLPLILKQRENELVNISKQFFSVVKEMTPDMVKQGQVKALSKEVVPTWKIQRYRTLHWYICCTNDKLILGDVGPCWEVDGDKRFISFTFKTDKIQNVFLPISSHHLVVGSSSSNPPNVNVSALNAEATALSREFFVSSERNSAADELVSIIGNKSEMISDEKIKKMVSNKFSI